MGIVISLLHRDAPSALFRRGFLLSFGVQFKVHFILIIYHYLSLSIIAPTCQTVSKML